MASLEWEGQLRGGGSASDHGQGSEGVCRREEEWNVGWQREKARSKAQLEKALGKEQKGKEVVRQTEKGELVDLEVPFSSLRKLTANLQRPPTRPTRRPRCRTTLLVRRSTTAGLSAPQVHQNDPANRVLMAASPPLSVLPSPSALPLPPPPPDRLLPALPPPNLSLSPNSVSPRRSQPLTSGLRGSLPSYRHR